MGKRTVSPLPAEYTNIPEVSLTKDEATSVPLYDENINITPTSCSLQVVLVDAYKWLEHGHVNIESAEWISWTAYNASLTSSLSSSNAITQMLPLFNEPSSTPAMVFHRMNVIKAAIHHLNSGQIPVMAVDQPLHTIAKRFQWKFPETHDEKCFVVMLGGLHIEKVLYQVLGDWLDGSGWTSLISSASVAGSSTAQAFLGSSHITRTRYIHQVTALAIYILSQTAYSHHQQTEDSNLEYHTWLDKQCKAQPQANFWNMALELQLTVLQVS